MSNFIKKKKKNVLKLSLFVKKYKFQSLCSDKSNFYDFLVKIPIYNYKNSKKKSVN